MKTRIFDGKAFARERELVLAVRIAKLGLTPNLTSVYFAEDAGSVLYTNLKQAAAARVGVAFHAERVSVRDTTTSIIRRLRKRATARDIHGLMLQKPKMDIFLEAAEEIVAGQGTLATLAKNLGSVLGSRGQGRGPHTWWKRLTIEIPPGKDVDCLNPVNLDRVSRGRWRILPATVRAVLSIIEVAFKMKAGSLLTGTVPVKGRVVVVGRSEIVGKPLAQVLAQRGFEVALCASTGLVARSRGRRLIETGETRTLAEMAPEADILISATGQTGLIVGEMVKRGAVVIDVGAPLGDVEFDTVRRKASFLTPVPGGVGPVTVVSLLENLVDIVSPTP